MSKMLLITILLGLAVLVLSAFVKSRNTGGRKATGVLAAKRPLTDREQAMYFRLRDTLPECVILAQLAFSALLSSKDRPTRATFDRKVADFVVCSKAFEVIAIIELDDDSHRGREKQDAARDELLAKAGYAVHRFKNVPDGAAVLKALAAGGGAR